MLECVPYIKSICHQVWITEWHTNPDDEETRKDDLDKFEVKDFYPKVKNTSLCVIDDLIVNVGSDEAIQPRSSDVIVPKQTIKHGNEHQDSVRNKEEMTAGRGFDCIIHNSR